MIYIAGIIFGLAIGIAYVRIYQIMEMNDERDEKINELLDKLEERMRYTGEE